MLPRVYATLLALGGALLALRAAFSQRSPIEPFRWPEALSLLGAFVMFAVLVRTAGLVPATAGALVPAYFAEHGRSARELAAVVVVVTAGCVLLFRFALGLPIPIVAGYW